MHQVMSHKESLKLQYSLKNRAIQCGWRKDQIEVVDTDLGISGKTIENRDGFKHVLAEVALENVGIIFSYDATRLSRNCSDWYQLLDICSFKKCLIGDIDSIYDPSTMNGRLLLGIKGQLAEIELSTIKSRLLAGRNNKAARGELDVKLPVGLIRTLDKRVEKDPNLEVQNTINTIFATFFRFKSVSMTAKYFIKNNLLIPRYNQLNQLIWKKPQFVDLLDLLKNPAYAGAYVFGQKRQVSHPSNPRKVKTQNVPYSEWKIIHNKYPSYITWEQYEMLRKIIADNYLIYEKNSRGISRPGACLLQGIAYCGQCGHKMVVEYNKRKSYICNFGTRKYYEKRCQTVLAKGAEEAIVLEFFNALSSIELDAYEKILSKREEDYQKLNVAKEQKLIRLRYQEKLAENRFNQVDPNNRLVAEELEKRWEQALIELKEEEEQKHLSQDSGSAFIPEELKLVFTDLGKRLPDLWDSGMLNNKIKKDYLRCLIEKVIFTRSKPDQVNIRIVWKGGEVNEMSVPYKVSAYKNSSHYAEIKEIIRNAYKNNKTDQEIVVLLTEKGLKQPLLKPITLGSVRSLRFRMDLLRPRGGRGSVQVKGYLTVTQICDQLGVNSDWLSGKIKSGKVKVKKDPKRGVYLFPDTKNTEEQMKLLWEKKLPSLNFIEEYQHD